MQTQLAIEQRRATKAFDREFFITDNVKRTLLELAQRAPSAFNLQHCRYVVVEDPEQRKRIREHAWDQAQVTDASMLVVLCADLESWQRDPERIFGELPEEARRFLMGAVDNYYRDKPRIARDEAMRSGGLAAQTLMLAATSMGYDTCPMDGFDFDKVGDIIGLPEGHEIIMMIAVGKRAAPPRPRFGKLPYEEVVFKDRF